MNKLLNVFQKPSAALLARVELEEAKRQLLAAQTALEYAQSMVTYNESKVKRLTAYLKKESTE
jgi:hypothetical protein